MSVYYNSFTKAWRDPTPLWVPPWWEWNTSIVENGRSTGFCSATWLRVAPTAFPGWCKSFRLSWCDPTVNMSQTQSTSQPSILLDLLKRALKMHLKDELGSDRIFQDFFSKYFTDESGMCHATSLELLHYVVILLDTNLSNKNAYRSRTELHVYSLLRWFSVYPDAPDGMKFLLWVRKTDKGNYSH